MGEKRGKSKRVVLSGTKLKVLQLAAKGLINKEIALQLSLSERTIDHLLSNEATRGIYPKIGVRSRAEATAWYMEKKTAYWYLRIIGDQNLRWIYQERMGGWPELALAHAEYTADLLRREIDGSLGLIGGLKPLLSGLARILFEQMIAFFEIAHPDEIGPFVKAKVKEMREIAEACQDRDLDGLADYALGMALYIMGRPLNSAQAFETAWNKVESNAYKLNILRTLALDWGYLGAVQEFEPVANKATKLIKRLAFLDPNFVCMALEGLGRSQGLLRLSIAFDTLDEGWQVYDQMAAEQVKMPIRYVQLVRSELEVAQYLEPREKSWLEARALEGLRLAKEYGYSRYAERIKKLSDLTFN